MSVLNKDAEEFLQHVDKLLTGKQRARLKELRAKLNDQNQLPIVVPENSLKLKRNSLKLIWASGREIITDDYGLVAAFTKYKTKTIVLYLTTQPNRKFKDLSGQEFTVQKIPVDKVDTTTIPDSYVYISMNPSEGTDGIYTMEEAGKLLGCSDIAVRRRLTVGNGSFDVFVNEVQLSIGKLKPTATMEKVKQFMHAEKVKRGY